MHVRRLGWRPIVVAHTVSNLEHSGRWRRRTEVPTCSVASSLPLSCASYASNWLHAALECLVVHIVLKALLVQKGDCLSKV